MDAMSVIAGGLVGLSAYYLGRGRAADIRVASVCPHCCRSLCEDEEPGGQQAVVADQPEGGSSEQKSDGEAIPNPPVATSFGW